MTQQKELCVKTITEKFKWTVIICKAHIKKIDLLRWWDRKINCKLYGVVIRCSLNQFPFIFLEASPLQCKVALLAGGEGVIQNVAYHHITDLRSDDNFSHSYLSRSVSLYLSAAATRKSNTNEYCSVYVQVSK